QAVDSRPPGSGLDDARAAHTTSALPVAWIVTPLCPATAACIYSIINVPSLTSIVKHSKGHRIAWGAISTYTAGGRHQDANPCPQPEADLARSPCHAASLNAPSLPSYSTRVTCIATHHPLPNAYACHPW